MIYEFIMAFVTYLVILYAAYYVTEVKRLPIWLQFPPFDCRKCLTFWSLVITAFVIGLSFDLFTYLVSVVALGVLTAISMEYDQRSKTVKIDE